MRLKKAFMILTAFAAALFTTAFSACGGSGTAYAESTEKINNPDQGFYRPIYVKVTESGATYNKNIVTAATQLYHLRVDISAFSKAVNGTADKPLTTQAADGIEGLLSYLKTNDKNAVVRFAYDPSYGGAKDKEPSLSVMKTHIGQVCEVLKEYESTVTAIEAGLIGPWGEMHSSAVANAQTISPVIDEFLNCTGNIPVLVRTPKMIYNYLGITINDIDGYEIAADNKAYRLGIYNDGYLGSDSDLGTYTDREREIAFISKQTAHLPYGGEVVIPNSKLHDIKTCLPEMHGINLNYLNIEWNNQVIDKWKNSRYDRSCGKDRHYYGKSAFTYIENRLGYRFVMTAAAADCKDGKLSVKVALNNVGFGNLTKKKHAKIMLVGEDGAVAFTENMQDFTGETELTFNADAQIPNGNYDVYIRLYGDEMNGKPLYCVQFANEGIWNAELKANKVGEITVK